jgi:hypothetical protein
MMETGICQPRAEGSALYHSRGFTGSALIVLDENQRWHFCHTEHNIYSVQLGPISLYLDRQVFERDFEALEVR